VLLILSILTDNIWYIIMLSFFQFSHFEASLVSISERPSQRKYWIYLYVIFCCWSCWRGIRGIFTFQFFM